MFLPDNNPMSELADAQEKATEAYSKSLDETAEAENAYLRSYHRAWRDSASIPASIRAKHTEFNSIEVVEAKADWNYAKAREKSCYAKLDELNRRQIALMSYNKFLHNQT